ncbi:MAG TPA: DNA primase [Candidatus Eremiobacteraceae bacterium]|nr:DNA primase [Candidatus Eremiobacteraceae bacterium]
MPVNGSVIAEIQSKVDLLAYVSQYVTLRKRGREYLGLCPFHAERTPSFSLNAEKQVWHCHGCEAGGDLITFVRRYENVEFPDALRMLATRAGIELQESTDFKRHRSEKEAIYELNALAKSYFGEALRTTAVARAYVERRGLAPETVEKFSIGYAPDHWEGLTDVFRRAHVDLALAARAGLLSQRQRDSSYCDFFRGRLMLPVFNLTGEVIAFGGRSLGDETPKYLNTRNTAAYTKGQHVYALQLARKAAAAKEALIVVEGYLDCIALHQAGFSNAVASLGTAFTPEQARELRRVAPNLYLCFDGDAAGQAATARSIDMLAEEGLQVRVASLPQGRDPDEIVLQDGAQAFAALIEQSQRWIDFKIELACSRIASRFANKRDIAREAMNVVLHVRDPIERDQYVKAMARRLDIAEQALRQVRVHAAPAVVPGREPDRSPQRRAPGLAESPSIERELVQLILVRPGLLPEAATQIAADDFKDEELRDTFVTLLKRSEEIAQGINPLTVLADQPHSAELTRLALSSPPLSLEEDERRLARMLDRFERLRMERRLSSMDAEMNGLLTSGQSVPEPLREEYNFLAATLRGSSLQGKEGR